MNTVFFGTPELAVWALEEMQAMGVEPSIVVTAPDKPAGRGRVLTPPPVKLWAQKQEIDVLQPEKLDAEFIAELNNSDWDAFIVFAYGKILPQALLDMPKRGTLNIHPSMLPKLRGPSPIRSAIIRNEPENVGVSIIELDNKMDHGPIVAQARVELPEWPVRGSELDALLARMGGQLLAEILPDYLGASLTPEGQVHDEATFCGFFTKADGELLESDTDEEKYCKFCAYDGWPGVYFFENGKRMKVTQAHLDDSGTFVIDRVIPEGKSETNYPI